VWPWAIGEFPEMADASDFKFGTQLEFAKAHHKITPRERVGMALG